MMSIRQKSRAIVCAMILVMLQGCGRASQGSFCAVYDPIYLSTEDTEETKRQIDGNNAAWLSLCQ